MSSSRFRVRNRVVRRRLHDEPGPRGRDRRPRLDRPRVRRRAARARARPPGEAARPAPLLWRSAKWVRGLTLTEHDEPGFSETYGYHDHGDPWLEQRYQ